MAIILELNNKERDKVQILIDRLSPGLPKTFNWWAIILAHLFKLSTVSIQREDEGLY